MPDLIITLTRLALKIAVFVMVGGAGAQTRIDLIAGWNLMGNSSAAPVDVAATFGDPSKINSVWTWNKTASKWAFYAPSMSAADLATYAQGKGYDLLISIPSKEGFWVNASTPSSLPLATSSIAKLAESDLQVGWNLVSSADFRTPSQLNQILSSSLNGAGKVIASTWAWDKKNGKWKFYAPSLEAQGGSILDDYVGSKGYLPFKSASTFSATDGYWVNIGSVPPSTTTRKAGLYYNYAKLGYYSDALQSNKDDSYLHALIDRFKHEGYAAILFEITIGITKEGNLQHELKYDRLLSLIGYAHSIGLITGILPNWNLNGGNADYLGYEGQILPADFKLDNFLNAATEYFDQYAKQFESNNLDLLYLAYDSPQFFPQEYYGRWKTVVDAIRRDYNGAITCGVSSAGEYWSSAVDSISIWNLMDAVSFAARPYISNTPIYDVEEIVSKYYYSELNGLSFMTEVIGAAKKYKLPLILGVQINSVDNALDGGADPTKQQSLQNPLPLNRPLQATAFKAFFNVVSNNLYPFVTGTSVGAFDIWAYDDFSGSQPSSTIDVGQIAQWNTFKYFSLTLFPIEAQSVINQYTSDPSSFRILDVTRAGKGDDVIYVKTGNNTIYLNGGYDEVNAGDGDDHIVISTISGLIPNTGIVGEVKIAFAGWFSSADNGSTYPIEVYLGTDRIATSSSSFDAFKSSKNPSGYWSDSVSLTIPIPIGSDLSKIQITMPGSNGGFIEIKDLSIYYFGNNLIDPRSASHSMGAMLTGDSKEPQPQWVYNNDITTYNLTSLNLGQRTATTSGQFTYIDGGDGVDTIEFDPPQNQSYFQITKLNGLTVIGDAKGFYPEIKMKNVEWIKFADRTVAVP